LIFRREFLIAIPIPCSFSIFHPRVVATNVKQGMT